MWIEWLLCVVLLTYQAFTHSTGASNKSTEDLIPCEKGWFYFRDKCYKIGGKRFSGRWSQQEAAAKCRNEGAKLVTIQSKELNEFLVTFLLLNVKTNAWIGLHDRNVQSNFEWEDGSEVNYTNWEPNEPSGGSEDCVEMVFLSSKDGGRTGMWNDNACSDWKAYICESKKSKKVSPDPRFCTDIRGGWKYQNSCYFVVSEKKSWEDAEKHCQDNFNGHLLTISDFTVDVFLEYVLKNLNREVWIGIKIKDQALQQWTSGWHVGYSEWDKDQDEDFVPGTCSLRSKQKLWKKIPCSNKYAFICETSSVGPPVLKPPVKGALCPEQSKELLDLGGEYCYFIDKTNKINWFRANFECLRRGGALASIHSEQETVLLHQFFKYTDTSMHIGLVKLKSDVDVVAWADGSHMDYRNWGKDEPNNEDHFCGLLWTKTMLWNDMSCDNNMGYICSVRKVSPNVTEIIDNCDCPSGVSVKALIGVSVCILLVVILVGIVIYCFRPRQERQRKRSSGLQLQPVVSTSDRPRYRSGDAFIKEDDGYYENMN